jgi:cobalt-zinc-cadmium efflux system protein
MSEDESHRHAHEGAHVHQHAAGHGHDYAPASFGRAFAIGVALNIGFVIVEAIYGILANSVALLADAGHNVGDVLALAVAWLASELVKRAPTARFTYGLRGSSILAALFNGVFLLVIVGAISWEAIRRLGAPEQVAGKTVMIVAVLGIVVNSGREPRHQRRDRLGDLGSLARFVRHGDGGRAFKYRSRQGARLPDRPAGR